MCDLETEDPEKFETFHQNFGRVLKLGAVEDLKNREKLSSLIRFTTTQRNYTSLDQVCLQTQLLAHNCNCFFSTSRTESKVKNRSVSSRYS